MFDFSIFCFSDAGFYVTFMMVVCCGALMNYSLFLCTALNSALTTSLIGVIKSVLQTAIGFFTFGGVTVLPLNATGIFMNLLGGTVYTYAKYRSKSESHPSSLEGNDDSSDAVESHKQRSIV